MSNLLNVSCHSLMYDHRPENSAIPIVPDLSCRSSEVSARELSAVLSAEIDFGIELSNPDQATHGVKHVEEHLDSLYKIRTISTR